MHEKQPENSATPGTDCALTSDEIDWIARDEVDEDECQYRYADECRNDQQHAAGDKGPHSSAMHPVAIQKEREADRVNPSASQM